MVPGICGVFGFEGFVDAKMQTTQVWSELLSGKSLLKSSRSVLTSKPETAGAPHKPR